MTSVTEKPVDCYVWINDLDTQVTFEVPGDSRRLQMHGPGAMWQGGIDVYDSSNAIISDSKGPWNNSRLVVDFHKIDRWFNYSGKFQFTVNRDGQTLTQQWQMVNAVTGNLGDGTLLNVQHQTAKYSSNNDFIVNYSFYDAAHNFGMNTTDTVDKLLATPQGLGLILAFFGPALGLPAKLIETIGAPVASKIIRQTSVNQKDSVKDQLAMGARFFEFRASRIYPQLVSIAPNVTDKLYFHHNVFPGISLSSFINDAVDFLCDHQGEIIVVRLTWNGWTADNKRKELETVEKLLTEAVTRAETQRGVNFVRADFKDMKTPTVTELRSQSKRFILDYDESAESSPYDVYESGRHTSFDGLSIIQEFESMSTKDQQGHAFTMLQCQSCLTNDKEVIRIWCRLMICPCWRLRRYVMR
ncbi:unnamed protein product [Calypogeia fissa]